jgi:hypothetical protein
MVILGRFDKAVAFRLLAHGADIDAAAKDATKQHLRQAASIVREHPPLN